MIIPIAIAILSWTVYCSFYLAGNISRARKIGIPYVIIPVSPLNTFWIVFEPVIYFVLDRLPFKLGAVNHYGRRGWFWGDKAQSHLQLGDAYAIVTPNEVMVNICDATAIQDVFTRRAEFVRPAQMYKLLDIFGPNISSVGWTDWQRQRKIVAAPFNENTNKFVWKESLHQAESMIEAYARCGSSGATGLGKDTRTLALDILAATGFQRSYPFRSSMDPVRDEARTYRESLAIVMDNTFVIMLFSSRVLRLPFAPIWSRRIGQAVEDFKDYMTKMFNTEKQLLNEGKPGTGNLMSSLVRASEADGHGNSRGLTLKEILGNIYVINFAGHDTTANTLAYSILLLAAYPEVQEWIAEEIKEVLKTENREIWDYNEAFPRLKRCHAVMLETVRLFPPIMALPKIVLRENSVLKLAETNRSIVIPKDTIVTPSLLAAHTHSKYWPDEPLHWRPQRWISNSTGTTVAERLEHEEVYSPPQGTYFPWSEGPQSCPGKKFAQVEFAAAMACLFREHRVRISLLPGEDFDTARARILAVTENSQLTLLLRMRDADNTRLVWEEA